MIHENINFKIITPEKVFFEHLVKIVNFPGVDGEFAVMKGHMHLVSTIAPGIVSSFENDKIAGCFITSGGISEIHDECSFFTEQVIRIDNMGVDELTDIVNLLKKEASHYKNTYKTLANKKICMAEILENFINKKNV